MSSRPEQSQSADLNFNTHRATNISYLKAGTGDTSIHVGNQQLINGTTAVVDWNSQKLTDGSGVDSVFWNLRTLHDAGTHTSIDWANRTLNDTSGNTLLNWLDTDLQITAGIVTTTGTQYVFGHGTALNANHIVECIAGDGDSSDASSPSSVGRASSKCGRTRGHQPPVAFGMAVPGSSASSDFVFSTFAGGWSESAQIPSRQQRDCFEPDESTEQPIARPDLFRHRR